MLYFTLGPILAWSQ